MNKLALRRFALISILVLSAVSFAQQPAPETPKDTITRIFTGEFSARFPPAPRWFDGGQSFITTEPAAGGHGRDLVKYDTATGTKREVLITAAQLTPEGAKEPLQSAALSWSKDNQRVLIFTNTSPCVAHQLPRGLLVLRPHERQTQKTGWRRARGRPDVCQIQSRSDQGSLR